MFLLRHCGNWTQSLSTTNQFGGTRFVRKCNERSTQWSLETYKGLDEVESFGKSNQIDQVLSRKKKLNGLQLGMPLPSGAYRAFSPLCRLSSDGLLCGYKKIPNENIRLTNEGWIKKQNPKIVDTSTVQVGTVKDH